MKPKHRSTAMSMTDEHTPYVISGFKADSRTQEVMYLVTTLKSLTVMDGH